MISGEARENRSIGDGRDRPLHAVCWCDAIERPFDKAHGNRHMRHFQQPASFPTMVVIARKRVNSKNETWIHGKTPTPWTTSS